MVCNVAGIYHKDHGIIHFKKKCFFKKILVFATAVTTLTNTQPTLITTPDGK